MIHHFHAHLSSGFFFVVLAIAVVVAVVRGEERRP